MKKLLVIILKMAVAFFLVANSTILALNSNLGLSPWDVFHQGLAIVTGMTLGQASIVVGIVLVILAHLLKLPIGFGTVANMVVVGCFIDWVNLAGYIPVSHNLGMGILMLIGSLLLLALGCGLYIGCEIGCGPRDGVMVTLSRLIGWKVGIIRLCMEMIALIAGWLLGGTVGVGSFVMALGTGFCMQLVFKLFKLDVSKLKHQGFKQSFAYFKQTNREMAQSPDVKGDAASADVSLSFEPEAQLQPESGGENRDAQCLHTQAPAGIKDVCITR